MELEISFITHSTEEKTSFGPKAAARSVRNSREEYPNRCLLYGSKVVVRMPDQHCSCRTCDVTDVYFVYVLSLVVLPYEI